MLRKSRALSLALAVAAVATLPGCPGDNPAPPRLCVDGFVPLRLAAGECQVIHNACREDGAWVEGDGLRITDQLSAPGYFYLETKGASPDVERRMCANPGNPPLRSLADKEVTYSTRSVLDAGTWFFLIDTVADLQLAVTAVPDAVAPGQSVVLEATPSGGLPPYSYKWGPADGVSGQGPVVTATPTATTAYQVSVTDSRGTQQQAFVKVLVTPSHCGDGIVDFPAETCDDGNTKSGDGCSSTCTLETTCQVDAASCLQDADCCSGFCSTTTKRCAAGR